MAVMVNNLSIALQQGTEDTLYATWKFTAPSTSSTGGGGSSGGGGGSIKSGSVVTVKSGAKWYNGAVIASFVFTKQWIVYEVVGNRAVIHKSTDGAYGIMSPINVSNLTLVNANSLSTLSVEPRASSSTLDHYEVNWYYATGNGVWFDGGSSNVTLTNATYNYPSNASKVKVTVKPVSKTYTSNGNTVSYWNGTNASAQYLISELPPDRLSAPAVTLDKYKLTAKVENIEDAKCEVILFEVFNGNVKVSSGTSTVATARASYTCDISAGGNYRVRCRAINYVGGSPVYGQWSPYSSELTAVPAIPKNVRVTAETETSVKVSWSQDSSATSYTVEYTTNRLYFDSSSEVSSITVEVNYAMITGIEPGNEYYFRVLATNDQGESGWSDIVYKIIGTKPEPPTTWSLTNTAIIGEPIVLYWVHNTEDGSKQNEAQIELTIKNLASGETTTEIKTVDTSTDEVDEDEVDKIYSYNLDLSSYTDGAEVLWRVRTRGITYEYSDWSVQRSINTYAPPVLSLTLGDGTGTLTTFPFNIVATASPSSQNAISYHLKITAEGTYSTLDNVGRTILVNTGDEVYSKIFLNTSNEFSFALGPEHVSLENNQMYKVTLTVAMNSGLTAEASGTFTVIWDGANYSPDASVTIDYDSLVAYIMPFCFDYSTESETGDYEYVTDVVLSVYRREYDGGFVEIGTNIENYGSISVTDPHPALDYARYRIVARNRNTGVMGFTDIPGIPVEEPSIVIQWNEEWTQFDYSEDTEPEIPPWTGSMLKLKGNVDITENYSPDSSMVEYIGRKHPVGYYGTQRGVTESWSTEIPKSDKETLYSLRRLAAWNGDVYVREPSGKGYTASITVSMSSKHLELTIPISFEVTRVESDEA